MGASATLQPAPRGPEPLWREVLGARLRRLRQHRGLTLTEVAGRAGISPQYLSEIERGRKEPSSEIVAAVAGALDSTVLEVTGATVADLRATRTVLELHTISAAPSATMWSGPVALAA